MTFNIRSGDSIYNQFDLNATAQVIIDADVQLVGLQEVDNKTTRHPVDEPAILSELTGMNVIFAKMRDYQGGGYGIAILSKYPILNSQIYYYQKPGSNSSNRVCGDPAPADYCQGAVGILVEISNQDANTKMWFVTTHIGLDGVELDQVKQLLNNFVEQLAKEEDVPVIFTGDFNSTPDSDALLYLYKQPDLTDSWTQCGSGPGYTFNSTDPYERIDYQFWRSEIGHPKTLECSSANVLDVQTSDHRPVVVQWTLEATNRFC